MCNCMRLSIVSLQNAAEAPWGTRRNSWNWRSKLDLDIKVSMFPKLAAHPTLSDVMTCGPVSRLFTNWGMTWEPDVTLLTFHFLLTLPSYPYSKNTWHKLSPSWAHPSLYSQANWLLPILQISAWHRLKLPFHSLLQSNPPWSGTDSICLESSCL